MVPFTPFDCRKRLTHYSRALFTFVLISLLACNEDEPDLVSGSDVGRWQYISDIHGLASNYVNVIFEDSQGNIWVGTTGGLSVLIGTSMTTYTVIDGLLDNSVYAISEDREGDIWVGTRRGVNIFSDGQWYFFRYFYNAPVYALLHLRDEQGMLIGTGGFGIYRYDYETSAFSLFNEIKGCETCNSINSMFQAKDGAIWIASFEGVRRIRGSFVTRFDIGDGLSGNITTTIAEDSWGNIWIGTAEGKTISKIDGNTVSQVSFNNGAEQNFIFGIQEDNDGNLWVGTVMNGLFHYDGAIMKHIDNDLTGDTITELFKDSDGNLWIGTSNQGVALYITNPRR